MLLRRKINAVDKTTGLKIPRMIFFVLSLSRTSVVETCLKSEIKLCEMA